MNVKQVVLDKKENTLIQLILYTFVGGVAFLADFGLLFVLTQFLKIHYLASATVSFLIGLVVNYSLSTKWVFDKRSVQNKSIEFAVFAIIGLIGLGANDLVIWLLTDKFHLYYLGSKIISTILVYLYNFYARKLILFR